MGTVRLVAVEETEVYRLTLILLGQCDPWRVATSPVSCKRVSCAHHALPNAGQLSTGKVNSSALKWRPNHLEQSLRSGGSGRDDLPYRLHDAGTAGITLLTPWNGFS